MFEKKAAEMAEEYYYKTYPVTLNIGEEERKKEVTDIFLAGYNKANEWHYVKDGDLPKECENVWCYCKGSTKFCCVGHIIVGGDNKIRWWANNKFEELYVIAWKEIVLPELKESE